MKEVPRLKNIERYIELREILRIGNNAVQKAKEENAAHGIPEFFSKNGKIYYQLQKEGISTTPPEILR